MTLVEVRAKNACALSLFESRADQSEILRETSRREFFHKLRGAAQLDLENDREIAIGAKSLEMQRRNLAKFLPWIHNTLDLFPRGVERFFNATIENRVENVFFTFEVKIDCAVRDTGFTSDVGDFRIEVAVMCEDAGGGAQDCLAFIANGGAHSS